MASNLASDITFWCRVSILPSNAIFLGLRITLMPPCHFPLFPVTFWMKKLTLILTLDQVMLCKTNDIDMVLKISTWTMFIRRTMGTALDFRNQSWWNTSAKELGFTSIFVTIYLISRSTFYLFFFVLEVPFYLLNRLFTAFYSFAGKKDDQPHKSKANH